MNFIKDDIKELYFKFLLPSMTSAVVMSIYSFVDAIAVGQSEGAVGTAAMAVISPVYGVLVFLAILGGIGGSVMMSMAKGEGKEEKGNACFTVAVLFMGIVTLVVWLLFLLFREQIFSLFGANPEIMPKTVEYGRWIVWFLPIFIFTVFISAFIRNDGAPKLAMTAVILGGCVNIFGDWFLVFPMKMGMTGAAIATVLGNIVQTIIMISHFFRKTCGLKLIKPNNIGHGFSKILQIGLGASVLDLGSVIIGILMNNQINRYGGTIDLGIYGVFATIMALFQALFAGVGQAVQPLVSANYGARKNDRIKSIWNLSIYTILLQGLIFTAIGELFPVQITKLFMNATPEVLASCSHILKLLFVLFLFLGFTVLSAYYLQSVMQAKMSVAFSLMHSVIMSGAAIIFLPMIFGINGVWVALPVAEFITAIGAVFYVSTNSNDTG